MERETVVLTDSPNLIAGYIQYIHNRTQVMYTVMNAGISDKILVTATKKCYVINDEDEETGEPYQFEIVTDAMIQSELDSVDSEVFIEDIKQVYTFNKATNTFTLSDLPYNPEEDYIGLSLIGLNDDGIPLLQINMQVIELSSFDYWYTKLITIPYYNRVFNKNMNKLNKEAETNAEGSDQTTDDN